jgi:hypothetical protein
MTLSYADDQAGGPERSRPRGGGRSRRSLGQARPSSNGSRPRACGMTGWNGLCTALSAIAACDVRPYRSTRRTPAVGREAVRLILHTGDLRPALPLTSATTTVGSASPKTVWADPIAFTPSPCGRWAPARRSTVPGLACFVIWGQARAEKELHQWCDQKPIRSLPAFDNCVVFRAPQDLVPISTQARENLTECCRPFLYRDFEPFAQSIEVEVQEWPFLSRVDRILSWRWLLDWTATVDRITSVPFPG